MGRKTLHPLKTRQGWSSALFVIVAAISLSVAVSYSFHRSEKQRIEASFAMRCTRMATTFQRTLEQRFAALHTLSAFYAASHKVRRDEFRTLSAAIRSQLTSIQALEWAPRITRDEREQYE